MPKMKTHTASKKRFKKPAQVRSKELRLISVTMLGRKPLSRADNLEVLHTLRVEIRRS